jgi:hypothetical protein
MDKIRCNSFGTIHFILSILWYNIHRRFGGREMEEKLFSKKFVWSILGGIAAVALVVYLIIINSTGGVTNLGNSLDGIYYVYHRQSNTVIEDNILKVDGKTALFKDAYWVKYGDESEGDMWRVDTEKQVIVVQETNLHEYPYVLKDGVLTFNNDSYVKEGSEIYKKAKKMSEWDYEND